MYRTHYLYRYTPIYMYIYLYIFPLVHECHRSFATYHFRFSPRCRIGKKFEKDNTGYCNGAVVQYVRLATKHELTYFTAISIYILTYILYIYIYICHVLYLQNRKKNLCTL